jgi:diguanylate cyclase (GGDEF)-like protein/PAS domain S-box-containing protein
MIKPTEDDLSLSLSSIVQEEQERQHVRSRKSRHQRQQRESAQRQRAQRQRLSPNELLHLIISNAPIVLFALDHAGNFIFSVGRGLDAIGVRSEERVGVSLFEVYKDIPVILNAFIRALDGETVTAITPIRKTVFETLFTPMRDAEDKNQIVGVIGMALDVTQRINAQQALQVSEGRFRTMIEQATDLILILDANGIFQYVSPAHQRLLGYAPEDLIGKRVFDYIHPFDKKRVYSTWANAFLADGAITQVDCRLLHSDGSWVPLAVVGRNCLNDPTINGFIINARDITERTAMEEQLRHQALFDALTDLPNRACLLERLEQTIAGTKEECTSLALLILDIDRFKEINDTFGHGLGDDLLKSVGERLRRVTKGRDIVARLGGDEFALLLHKAGKEDATRAAQYIHILLEKPFHLDGHTLQIGASIGGVLYPVHGDDPLTLLRRADIAMYAAKQTHKEFVFYESQFDQNSPQRLDLLGSLRHAIIANQLMLYYQPKADIKTGAIRSVEALIRWQHPKRGLVFPDQFIPLAEQTGLITSLTPWILETAIRQCRAWRERSIDLEIAVNLSMWDLHNPSLFHTISSLFERYQLPPDHLRIELTESSMMADPERTLAVLKRLALLGVQCSIDDFGTGYSSLTYLKRLSANELKIDRSFVQHIAEVEADEVIVRSTISMAHSLGLKVVAEGVEDAASLHLLEQLDCDLAQGYYLARPLPVHEFEHWLGEVASSSRSLERK